MRGGRAVLLLAAALCVAFGAAAAPSFTPASAPARFVFDEPDGHYEDWKRPLAPHVNALRASVRFSRYGKPTTEWRPGVAVLLARGDTMIKISLLADKYRPPFSINMVRLDGDKKTATLDFAATTGASGRFDIVVTWTCEGVVSLYAGGEAHEMALGWRPADITVVGSTGAGEVSPLELGTVRDDLDSPDNCKEISDLAGGPPRV